MLALTNRVALKFFTVLKSFLSLRVFEKLALAMENRVAPKFFKPEAAAAHPASCAYEPITNTWFRIQLVQSCHGFIVLLVNLPNFSSGFSNFIKSFIKILETSVEYICCEIVSADDIAGGQAVKYKRLV